MQSRMLTTATRALVATAALSSVALGQEVKHIPLVAGLTLVSATQLASGDQENVVTVSDVSAQGASYGWTFRQHKGNSVETGTFKRFVRIEDLTSAPRLNPVFFSTDVDRFPGSTAFSISGAVLQKLKAGAPVPYSLAQVDGVDFGTGMTGAMGGLMNTRVYMRGTLTPNGSMRMPLIVNGRRVTVPVAQARGSFAMQGRKVEGDFLVLDDAQHPLLLKVVIGKSAFQMIRVDFPDEGSVAKSLEAELASRCRAEIPGVYFDFGTADLRPESSGALADIGHLMAAHSDWKLAVEGHTDAVGTAAANLALSQRRAEAVRAALTNRYRVPPARITSAGFGQTKPKEPNTTIEGRARNRRVELVRSCSGKQ